MDMENINGKNIKYTRENGNKEIWVVRVYYSIINPDSL